MTNDLLNIDISWNFDDIIPSDSNYRMLNFPLPKNRESVLYLI